MVMVQSRRSAVEVWAEGAFRCTTSRLPVRTCCRATGRRQVKVKHEADIWYPSAPRWSTSTRSRSKHGTKFTPQSFN